MSSAGTSELDQLGPQGSPTRWVSSGHLDEHGHGEFSMRIPLDPRLVGHRWLWQAMIGGVVTNREVTTITDL